MKVFKKVLMAILAVIPAIYTAAAVLFYMPDTVPAHFGFNGEVDRYGSKYEAFILPGVLLAVYLTYLLVRYFIKKSSTDENDRTQRNLDIMDTVIILTLVLMNALDIFILLMMGRIASIYEPETVAVSIVSTVVGATFILIGNLLPKTKRNSFIGLRMRFTMDTDEHWYIANRAGGIALVISGLVTMVSGLLLRNIAYVFCMVGALLITLTVAIICSYVKIKKENNI